MFKYEKCWYCENFYGPSFDEPICLTCHYFIFPNIVEHDTELTSSTAAGKRFNIEMKFLN